MDWGEKRSTRKCSKHCLLSDALLWRVSRGFNYSNAIHSTSADYCLYPKEELNEFDTMKYLKQPDGISYDVYDIEMVIAVAFRICSKESVLFRRFIINEISTIKKATPITLFVASVRGNNRWYS